MTAACHWDPSDWSRRLADAQRERDTFAILIADDAIDEQPLNPRFAARLKAAKLLLHQLLAEHDAQARIT